MSQQAIRWTTALGGYSINAFLKSGAPKIDFHSQVVVSLKNVGAEVDCRAQFELYSSARPRLQLSAQGQFLLPGKSGNPAELGVLSLMAYAEVSGQDIVPDVWTASLTYMRDYRDAFNANTEQPMAFHRV